MPLGLYANPVAIVFDEYDAGSAPMLWFVIQRVLEVDGKLTLLDQNTVITPHPCFRMFATANTVGLGDTTGLYHGTQQINQGQMDRWSIVASLNYLPHDQETKIIASKTPKVKPPDIKTDGHGRGAHPQCLYERGIFPPLCRPARLSLGRRIWRFLTISALPRLRP